MKLIIKENKLEEGYADNELLQLLGTTGKSIKDFGKSIFTNLAANVALFSKIGYAALFNILSKDGSWKDFDRRIRSANRIFSDKAKKSQKILDDATVDLLRSSGFNEKEIAIATAAAFPGLTVANALMNAFDKKDFSIPDLATNIARRIELERYDTYIFQMIYLNFFKKEIKSSDVKEKDRDLVRNIIKRNKFLGDRAIRFFRDIVRSDDKKNDVERLFSSCSRNVLNVLNKKDSSETAIIELEKTYVAFFQRLKESLKIKNNEIILEKKDELLYGSVRTGEYQSQVKTILQGTAFILIKNNIEEIKKHFIDTTVGLDQENFDMISQDVSYMLLKKLHIDSLFKAVIKQMKAIKNINSTTSFNVLIDEYKSNINKNSKIFNDDIKDKIVKFVKNIEEGFNEGSTNPVELLVVLKKTLQDLVENVSKDSAITEKNINEYIKEVESKIKGYEKFLPKDLSERINLVKKIEFNLGQAEDIIKEIDQKIKKIDEELSKRKKKETNDKSK